MLSFFFLQKKFEKKKRIDLNKMLSPGPEVIKLFSCSTQLSMKFVGLINLKLLTTANSFLLNDDDEFRFNDASTREGH